MMYSQYLLMERSDRQANVKRSFIIQKTYVLPVSLGLRICLKDMLKMSARITLFLVGVMPVKS